MIEKTILSNLILNEEFSRKVFPYLKEDYFDYIALRKLFSTVSQYVEKYKEPPSKEALRIAVDNRKDLNEDNYNQVSELINELKIDKDTNIQYLIDQTEKFCQDKIFITQSEKVF